jgi:uncharacterized protein involved in exopolysaccharide biosynthesis
MTTHAWLVTTWGKVRETLQPELFALRNEMRALDAKLEYARAQIIAERNLKVMAQRQLADVHDRLAVRSRELKAARAKLKRAMREAA